MTATLTLYYHPLSSFCWKVLMALYENETPFTPHFVDFADSESRDHFLKVWPIGQFPVLHDSQGDRLIPESSIIIEYLDQHYPGAVRFIPDDRDLARQMRLRDRVYDLHIQTRMQKIVTDNIRPKGQNDPFGVAQAREQMKTALDMADREMAQRTWAMGETLSMADCAAAPALFYADKVMPLAAHHPHLVAYLERLKGRDSFARVLKEAEPYFANFPG